MDLAGGDQPFYTEDGARAIVANGEFYNHLDLRAGLANRHSFLTRSDTEPVLHLYEELEADTPAELDGMFAFAIADGRTCFWRETPSASSRCTWGARAIRWCSRRS